MPVIHEINHTPEEFLAMEERDILLGICHAEQNRKKEASWLEAIERATAAPCYN